MNRFQFLLFALGLILLGPYLVVTRFQSELERNRVLSMGVSSTAVVYGGIASGEYIRELKLVVRYRANNLTQEQQIPVSSEFF